MRFLKHHLLEFRSLKNHSWLGLLLFLGLLQGPLYTSASSIKEDIAPSTTKTCKESLSPNILNLLNQINTIYDHQLITPEVLTQMENRAPSWWKNRRPTLLDQLERTPLDFKDLRELERFLDDLSEQFFPASQLQSHCSSQESFLKEEAKRTLFKKGLLQLIDQLHLSPATKLSLAQRLREGLRPLLKFFGPSFSLPTGNDLSLQQAELIFLLGTEALRPEEKLPRKFMLDKFKTYGASLSLMSLVTLGIGLYHDVQSLPPQTSSQLQSPHFSETLDQMQANISTKSRLVETQLLELYRQRFIETFSRAPSAPELEAIQKEIHRRTLILQSTPDKSNESTSERPQRHESNLPGEAP